MISRIIRLGGWCFLSLGLLVFSPQQVFALPLETMSNELERINETTPADQTIYFNSPTGVSAGQTITITFPGSSFAFGSSYDYTDMALAEGNSNNCETATYTPEVLGASPSGSTWGAVYSSNVVTITSGTGSTTADTCIRLNLNSNSTNHDIINPTVSSNTSYTIAVVAGADSGSLGVVILNDAGTPDGDQVRIDAQLFTAISMDIDTTTANCNNSTETSAPNNTVDLGILYPGQVKTSGSTINYICVDLGTNSAAGVMLRVRSSLAGATGGLDNTSSSGTILSATADLTSGAVNSGYGLRVSSTGTPQFGTFTPTSPFDSGSTANVGIIPGASTAPASIVTSTDPAQTGTASRIALELSAKAAISSDPGSYEDTLVFSALINF